MTITDQYIPAFILLENVRSTLTADASVQSAQLAQQFLDLLSAPVPALLESDYLLSDIENAQFAIAALVDEVVLSSQYADVSQWQVSPLQKQLFAVTTAGIEFFKRLDNLNELDPQHQDVREVYLFCLKLGFTGCYFDIGHRAKLDSIIQANYQLLRKDILLPRPEFAMEQDRESVFKSARKSHGFEIAVIWAPVVFVFALYVYLRADISSQIALLVQNI